MPVPHASALHRPPRDTGAIPRSLPELEAALEEELDTFSYPVQPWTREIDLEGEPVYDAVVIGGGQAGLTVAARLQLEGIGRVLVVDREPEGSEGPWRTWARMRTLRTAKYLHGTDNGRFHATFRAWYTSQHGAEAYEALELIPNGIWADYLLWLRRVFAVTEWNLTEVTGIAPEGPYWSVELRGPERPARVLARKIIVCTGIDGNGGAAVPKPFADLPTRFWKHSSDRFPHEELVGRRVVVIGAGASAFDNAAVALESGASSVRHLVRRPALPEVNTLRFLETRGFFSSFSELPTELKLAFIRRTFSTPMPPPPWSVERCTVHENYSLEFGTSVQDAAPAPDDSGVRLRTNRGDIDADLVILGTGFVQDLASVPWLAGVSESIRTWDDEAALGDDATDRKIAAFPFLGSTMELLPRAGGETLPLERIHLLNGASLASIGDVAIGNNGMPWAVSIVARGIVRDLFREDAPAFLTTYGSYDESEFVLDALVEHERRTAHP